MIRKRILSLVLAVEGVGDEGAGLSLQCLGGETGVGSTVGRVRYREIRGIQSEG